MSIQSRTVFGLAFIAFATTGFSSCRFGNHVVKAADPTAMSGYYKTEAATMTVCAFVSGQASQCASASLSTIPSSITEVMTNPVYVSANTTSSKAYIVPNTLNTNTLFEMSLDPSGKITATPYSDTPSQLWTDPACLSQVQIQKEGMIKDGVAGAVGSFKTRGSVDFTLGVLTVLGNQCTATLNLMAACYQDVNQCPSADAPGRDADQQAIQRFLDPYISRGVLTLANLPGLQGLGWEVNYQ